MTTTQPSLKTTVAGIEFPTCIYNASGPRTGSAQALAKIAKSKSGGILAKSATLQSQTGNPQPRIWQSEHASMNSEGLPNSGIDYYLSKDTIDEVRKASADNNEYAKPYMVSISGHTLQDNLTMLKQIMDVYQVGDSGISAVELNLACPNVIGHPIIAYDFQQMDAVLKAVSDLYKIQDSTLPLGVKMPPYFDGPHFQSAATTLNNYKHVVKYVASINTIGNALSIDTHSEMPVISSKGGFAGLSGPAVKYTALANVRQMRTLLDPSIDVVGVGGVQSGEDAFQLLLCGASAVQVGTCHWIEGPGCFDRICVELADLMFQKGYSNIKQFKNQLRSWSKEGASSSRAVRKANENALKESQTQASLVVGKESALDMVNVVLMVLIAVLAADKFGLMSL